jgi:hypothetical protein
MSKNIKHELNENFKGFFLYAQKQNKKTWKYIRYNVCSSIKHVILKNKQVVQNVRIRKQSNV